MPESYCVYCGVPARHTEPTGAYVVGVDAERSKAAGYSTVKEIGGVHGGWLCRSHVLEFFGFAGNDAVATNDEGTEFEMDGITFVFES